LTFGAIEQAVTDLKLPKEKMDSVAALTKAERGETNTLTTMARAELVLQLGDVLNDDELKTFKTVLNRQPGVGDRPNFNDRSGPGGRNGPPRGRGGPPGF
jgi:hypothetical protein